MEGMSRARNGQASGAQVLPFIPSPKPVPALTAPGARASEVQLTLGSWDTAQEKRPQVFPLGWACV